MEQLLSIDEIIEMTKLPKKLSSHPWLEQTYGTVEWATRGIYNTYIGWFDGQAQHLRPLKQVEQSENIIRLAGGPANLVLEIRNAQIKALECGNNIATCSNFKGGTPASAL